MRKLQFREDREFDYGDGVVLHRAGDVVAVHEEGEPMRRAYGGDVASLRSDKAQRWAVRHAAIYVDLDEAIEPALMTLSDPVVPEDEPAVELIGEPPAAPEPKKPGRPKK